MNEGCGTIIQNNKFIIRNIMINLEKLINDYKLREKMSHEARNFAIQYTVQNYYNNLCKIIN